MGYEKTKPMPPLQALAKKLEPEGEHIEHGLLESEKKWVPKQQKGSKHMPPLEALAKKKDPQAGDLAGSGDRKDGQKRAHKQEEEKDTTKNSGLGPISEPAHKKARAESHSERVENPLDRYQNMPEREDEKGGDLGTGVKGLPTKRSFQVSKHAHFDNSEFGAKGPEGSRKTESNRVTGGKVGGKQSESPFDREQARSTNPFVGTQGRRADNRKTPQAPIGSWVTKNAGNNFKCFEQWDLGDDE